MMRAAILALLIATPAAAEPISIFVVDATSSDPTVAPLALIAFTEIAAAKVAVTKGFRTITSADLKAILDLEAQAAHLGCVEGTCLNDLADALGAPLLLVTRYTVSEEQHALTFNLVEVATARTVASRSVQRSDPGLLLNDTKFSVGALLEDYRGLPIEGQVQQFGYDPWSEPRGWFSAAITGGTAATGAALAIPIAEAFDPATGGLAFLVSAPLLSGGAALAPALFFSDKERFWLPPALTAGSVAAMLAVFVFVLPLDDAPEPVAKGVLYGGGAGLAAFFGGFVGGLTTVPEPDTILYSEE